MVFDELLRVAHTGAVALYVGGAIIVTLSLRRALEAIPPAQAGIVGSRVGTDFTLISWFALVTWGASGYWLLQRGDWDDFRSPHTLFIRRDLLDSGFGWMLVLMVAAWLGMVINGLIITFVLRPHLMRRLDPSEAPEKAERLQHNMALAARAVELLALANLLLAIAATVAGHRFFEHVYIY
jgi:hypothetical protein